MIEARSAKVSVESKRKSDGGRGREGERINVSLPLPRRYGLEIAKQEACKIIDSFVEVRYTVINATEGLV